MLLAGPLALFPAAFCQELESSKTLESYSAAAKANEQPLEQISAELSGSVQEAEASVVHASVRETMTGVLSGSVHELVDLSSELISTENSITENIDESFLHFQGINDLLSIPSVPILAIAQASNSSAVIIGEGSTTNGEPCLIEREQLSSLNSKNNPYAKSVLLRMTIVSRSGAPTYLSIALNEEDADFRLNTYSRETELHRIDRETLNIEAKRISQVLGAEPKIVRSEISATLELQKLRALRITTEWQNENLSLQIKSDASCLNIQSESKASKVFAKAL